MFNGAQVHLLLNHLPILGIPFSTALLLYGLWRKNLEIQKLSMGALVLVGLLTIPAFLSGEAAEEVVENVAGVSEAMIEEHEEFSEISFWFLEGLAVVALAGLVYFREPRKLPKWLPVLILAGMFVGSGLMAWTGHLGGQINHPEIRSGSATTIQMDSGDDYHDEDER